MSTASRLIDFFRSGTAKACSWGLRQSSPDPKSAIEKVATSFGMVDFADGVQKFAMQSMQNGKKLNASAGEAVFSEMLGGWGFGVYPGSWTGNRIEQIQHYRHWVWKAIRLIMDLSTKEPPFVVDVQPRQDFSKHQQDENNWRMGKGYRPNPRRWLSPAEHRKSLQMVRPHEVFEHVEEDAPLKKIMDHPNEWDTGADLDQELIMFLELTGNSYEWPVPYKNAPGIAERWIMPAHWVWPQRTGKSHRLVDYYEIRPWGQSAASVPFRFDVDELIQYRYKSPLSKIDGQSPCQAGAEIIDAYEQTQLARFFSIQNGANVGDVVQLDASTDPNEEKIQRFLAQWKNRYQGIFNFGAPGVLPPGAELIRRPGELELAYGASSDQLRDYVLAMWGLTKSVVGFMEDANRASFEAALAQTFYLVVNPRLKMIDDTRNDKMVKPYFGKTNRVFHRDMTPADRTTELGEWQAMKDIAPYRGNEYRQWMGLEPLEEGEQVMQPMAMGAAGAMQDPMGGITDDDLMGRVRAPDPGEENGNGSATNFGGGFGKRWRSRFSVNGRH